MANRPGILESKKRRDLRAKFPAKLAVPVPASGLKLPDDSRDSRKRLQELQLV
jgi:hypothetical protein